MNTECKINPTDQRLRQRTQRELIYMVTIRKHQVKDFVSKYELTSILQRLCTNLTWRINSVTNVVYELAKHNQLHLHCILTCCRSFQKWRYNKIDGFFIHFKNVYNLDGAVSYLQKQVRCRASQDEVFTINFFSHHYGFI